MRRDSPDQTMARAVALARAGDLRGAVALLERLVKAAPGLVPARYNLALLLLMSGRHAEALPHLGRILARDPAHAEARFSKAKGLLALDRAEEALALLEGFGASDDPEILLARGNALRRLGRVAEAVEAFRRLAEVAPRHPGGPLNLAQMLLATDPAAAHEAVDAGLRRMPGHPVMLALRGQAALRLGRPEAAVADLRQALAADPTLGPARGHLLRACRETADWAGEAEQFAALRTQLSREGACLLYTSRRG